jgi:hypothetical protein
VLNLVGLSTQGMKHFIPKTWRYI